MPYDRIIVDRAKEIRRKGHSLSQIATQFRISKSTASLWTSRVEITPEGKKRIINRQNKARARAFLVISKRRSLIKKEIEKNAKLTLKKIKLDRYLSKLLCSIFIWTEGEKGKFRNVGFTNSDPKMISTFLYLIRNSFKLDELKFRALIHIHEYHDETEIIKFWSEITMIPQKQFTKSYLKSHTGKRIRENYMGSIHIRYYDYKVARELASVYNMFADKFRGVG